MVLRSTFLVFFVTAPVFTSVVKQNRTSCSYKEFGCGDGACVSIDHVCDGLRQCADGSDEWNCQLSVNLLDDSVLQRSKRQATGCSRNQWRCRDGSCISFDGKCDGVVDCGDGSDETHALCRKSRCQSHLFRCTYGACVDGTAPCNGRQECADNSDELLPRCTNTTKDIGGKFRCDNGEAIPSVNKCDGAADCADGSDETVRACAGKSCPEYLFQCAYGACVDGGSDCNQRYPRGGPMIKKAGSDDGYPEKSKETVERVTTIQDCADNSDEDDALCNRQGVAPKPGGPTTTTIRPNANGLCVLPPFPDHGRYSVAGVAAPAPGRAYDVALLNVTCDAGYGVDGDPATYCYGGVWSQSVPKCVRFCNLKPHPSVDYLCLVSGGIQGTRQCQSYEPTGTVVKPQCRTPNYYFPGVLPYMRCIEGSWDYVARCNPECGTITPAGDSYVIDGVAATRGELPWHAGIYKKTTKPYMQICGGSLVSTNVIISAAHCFWNDAEKKQPANRFAAAVGKIYRPWNDKMDESVQRSDVRDIHMPARFQGAAANFQEDIALVILATAIQYMTFVRPVCLDFDITFEQRQLTPGNKGKVAGWGLTSENGKPSPILQVLNITYVSVEECISSSPQNFREYITSDKICAGDSTGKALCKGDSGGGLVFPEKDQRGVPRYYLRGIVSTAPRNDNACSRFPFTTFTQITRHEPLIKEYVLF